MEPVTEPLRQGVIVYQTEALAGVAYKVTDQIVATSCKRKPWSQPATREDATEQRKLKATALGANGLMDVWCGNSTGILGSPQDCWGAITCTATAIQVTR